MDTLRHIIPLLTADSSTVVTPILCTAIVIFRPMQSISLTPRLIFHVLLIPASCEPFKKPLIYFRYNPTSIPINGNGNHRKRNSLQSTVLRNSAIFYIACSLLLTVRIPRKSRFLI